MRQRRHVVDDPRPGIERGLHDCFVPGIDRHDGAGVYQGADDRFDAQDFLLRRDFSGPGTRRFAPDVDNVGSSRQECAAVGDRALRIEPLSAVGEAIGRYVEDAHDDRAVEIEPSPWRPRRRQERKLLSHPLREPRAGPGNP